MRQAQPISRRRPLPPPARWSIAQTIITHQYKSSLSRSHFCGPATDAFTVSSTRHGRYRAKRKGKPGTCPDPDRFMAASGIASALRLRLAAPVLSLSPDELLYAAVHCGTRCSDNAGTSPSARCCCSRAPDGEGPPVLEHPRPPARSGAPAPAGRCSATYCPLQRVHSMHCMVRLWTSPPSFCVLGARLLPQLPPATTQYCVGIMWGKSLKRPRRLTGRGRQVLGVSCVPYTHNASTIDSVLRWTPPHEPRRRRRARVKAQQAPDGQRGRDAAVWLLLDWRWLR